MPSSSAAAAIASNALRLSGPQDEGFWEGYLKQVTDEDIGLITRWQKLLDTLLIYIGLFIGVLTAFIILISSMFQPGPGDATNKILIAIYNHTMNASSPIDLQQYIAWDETFNSSVSTKILLLYISLAISVTVAALVLMISVWLTRYHRSLTEMGPTIQDRIMKRHESYNGLMEWGLPTLIETLPMGALVALALFAIFFRKFIWGVYPVIGATLNIIFIIVASFFVLTASFAAFIPGAPFHSPLSSSIRFIFRIFPNQSIRGVVRIRTICVICVVLISGVLLQFFNNFSIPSIIGILLLFLLPVAPLSLCQRTQAGENVQGQPKPRLFTLATWLYSNSIVILVLFFAAVYLVSLHPVNKYLGAVFFLLSNIELLVMTIVAVQMSQLAPDFSKAKAEAVAWAIKTQPSHDLGTFQIAVEIAQNSAHLRSTLLEDILPILDVLINSIRGVREQDIEEERIYITLLAVLVNFEPSKASFWRNEAAVKRPVLSAELKEKLDNLSQAGCTVHTLEPGRVYTSEPPFGCTKAEAEFILAKVGRGNRLTFSPFEYAPKYMVE